MQHALVLVVAVVDLVAERGDPTGTSLVTASGSIIGILAQVPEVPTPKAGLALVPVGMLTVLTRSSS